MTYARARAFASLPIGRLPIVPASIDTCARAFCSENKPALRVHPASAGKRARRKQKQVRWLIEASGVDIRRLDAIGLVVETSCRYHAELEFPGTFTAGLALERLGTSSVVYRLALFGAQDLPAATGRFVHVYVDRTTRRPVRVPDVVRAALTHLKR